MAEIDPQQKALRDLELYAYELAAGRAPERDISGLVAALRLGSPKGVWLLRILNETATRVMDSASARRQFFHATRAFVSLRRDPLASHA